MTRNVRGVRDSIPAGYVLGRKGTGSGPAQLIKITDLVSASAVAQATQGGSTAILPANPTATASDTVVNGSAATFMRSDAAPPVQKASATQFGIVKVDGTSIISTGGVLSTSGGASGANTWSCATATGSWSTNTTVAAATMGNGLLLNVGITVDRLTVGLNANSAHTYKAAIYTVDGSLKITAIAAADATITPIASGIQDLQFSWATPVALTAGVTYILAVSDTSGGASDIIPWQNSGTQGNRSVVYANLPVTTSSNINSQDYLLAKTVPAINDTFTLDNTRSRNISIRAQV